MGQVAGYSGKRLRADLGRLPAATPVPNRVRLRLKLSIEDSADVPIILFSPRL
jgi:hypothetical protein